MTTPPAAPGTEAPTSSGYPISFKRRFGTAILWNLIASVSNQGSTFAVNLILANVLGRSAFGQYAIVLSTIQLATLVAGMAMGYTATRYIAEFRSTDRRRAGRVLTFCVAIGSGAAAIAALVFLTLAVPIAGLLKEPALVPLVQLAAGTALFAVVNGVLTGALAGLEAYAVLARIGVVSGLLYTAVCVALGLRWHLAGAVGGLAVSAAIQTALLARALPVRMHTEGIRFERAGFGAERAIVARFALPSALAGASYAAALWTGQALLARQGNGYAELAGYVAAMNLTSIVLFAPSVANSVGNSLLNNIGTTRGGIAYRIAFGLNLWATVALVTVGAGVVALAGRVLLGFYGAGFTAALPVLLLLLGGAIPESLTTALFQIMQTKHRMWSGLRSVILPRDLTFALAAVLWIPVAGARGLAGAYLVGRLVGLMSAFLLSRRLHGVDHAQLAGAAAP